MADVLVCAKPEAREEASHLVSKLGARPQVWSVSVLRKRRRDKLKGVFVYLRGTEALGTLRSCLKQVPKESPLHVVVFSHPSSDHQAAELGRIVGELRPRRTHICFNSHEVERIFHVQMHLVPHHGRDYAVALEETERDSGPALAALREELDLTQVDLAAALDVTPRTVQNWESRGGVSERRYRDFKELHNLVLKYIQSDQIAAWMDSPNDAFGKRTPRQLIREGKVRDLILEFRRVATGEPL